MQPRPVGRTLPGFRRHAGSNRFLKRAIMSSVSLENWRAIISIFSMPTPCSPVIEPPTLMQYSRISSLACLTFRSCARGARIEHDQRVQIAVAGVENVADGQAGAIGQSVDEAQGVGDFRPRHDAVLNVIRGADSGRLRRRRSCGPSIAVRAPGVVARRVILARRGKR